MRVLITGAGGFIGYHLVKDQLKYGRDVTAVDLRVGRLEKLRSNPRLKILEGNFCDPDLLEPHLKGQDVCFHLASAHLEVGVEDAYFWRINVQGAKELVERACHAGIGHFVHVSSVGVMGDVKNPPAGEEYPCHPTNIYEKTKLAGEQEVVQFAEESGYPVVIVRPAWVYGPHCPRTEKLLRTIKKGRFVIFGDGQRLRHPIFIADMVRALELSAEKPNLAGQRYIIAGPKAVSILELVETAADALGVPQPSLRLPLILGRIAGRAVEAAYKPLRRQPPFSRRSIDFFLKDNAYDISKARTELGFEPQVDLLAGFSQTIQWQTGHNFGDLVKEVVKNG